MQPTVSVSPDLIDRLRRRLERSPAQHGLEIVSLELDSCELALDFLHNYDNGNGSIHGGVLAMLADTAVACALSTNFDGKMGFATSNLNIHFLRKATTRVVAKARIVKKGRTVCVGHVDIYDAHDQIVATCTTDFILTTTRESVRSAEK
jgi:acyl-CoA thioesterase